jgi:hypothetical protein
MNPNESQVPSYTLEVRAADERRRLGSSVAELRSVMREKLDVRRAARQYLPVASAVVALVGLGVGYSFGGLFTRS